MLARISSLENMVCWMVAVAQRKDARFTYICESVECATLWLGVLWALVLVLAIESRAQ